VLVVRGRVTVPVRVTVKLDVAVVVVIEVAVATAVLETEVGVAVVTVAASVRVVSVPVAVSVTVVSVLPGAVGAWVDHVAVALSPHAMPVVRQHQDFCPAGHVCIQSLGCASQSYLGKGVVVVTAPCSAPPWGQSPGSWAQHQSILSTDQSLPQAEYPSRQSYSGGDGACPLLLVVVAGDSQPRLWYRQHHAFFLTDQPATQFL